MLGRKVVEEKKKEKKKSDLPTSLTFLIVRRKTHDQTNRNECVYVLHKVRGHVCLPKDDMYGL